MTCTTWRGITERIDWMLDHPPGSPGWCARETWQALGGDKSPPCPPAWGAEDANAVYDKIIMSGRYWTSTPIPDGAVIAWKYGDHGHLALAWQGGICTTDPTNNPGGVGLEDLDYPERWGASPSARIWTDSYSGVVFDVGIGPGDVYLSKLHWGYSDSDSVRRLQQALNAHSLAPPGNIMLPITGGYFDQTDTVVRADQAQHGYGSDPAGGSSVGPQQAEHLFAGTGNTIINDLEEPEEPTVANDDYWYSGKPSGTLTFGDSYKRLDVDKWAPSGDGLVLSMLYLNVKGEGEFRVRLCRDPDDYTAYQTCYAKAGDSFLLTHVWFEWAEANRKLWWEVGAPDSGYTMEIGTRYAKFAMIR